MSMERVNKLLQQSNSAMAIGEFDKVTDLQKEILMIVKQQSEQIEGHEKQFTILNGLYSKEQHVKRKYSNLCEQKDQQLEKIAQSNKEYAQLYTKHIEEKDQQIEALKKENEQLKAGVDPFNRALHQTIDEYSEKDDFAGFWDRVEELQDLNK